MLSETITAIRSVKQSFRPSSEALQLMETFRKMVNECIRIGLDNNVSSMKKLCNLAYGNLAKYDVLSYYKLCANSHAAAILGNREKSIRRKMQPKQPCARKPLLITCYGFKVIGSSLKVPMGNSNYLDIALNNHVQRILSTPLIRIRSVTLTSDAVSICYSREIEEITCRSVEGIDRNLSNLTVGNHRQAAQYDLSKAVEITESTRSVMASFKRNDVRIRKRLYSKYGARRKYRVNQLLHCVSKAVVHRARDSKNAIVFEDICGLRKLYQRGNFQSRAYRDRMNGWSFSEIKRQIEYKAKWEGLPIVQLSRSETRGTSQLCPQCGKKITQVERKTRQLYCAECKKWMDRDVVAAMNISIKGLARFASSKGLAGEAMVQESDRKEPVILKVDASKLCQVRVISDSTEPLNLAAFAG